MNEISCEMCLDLMPLAKDGVASPDSMATVQRHIAGCDSCREIYEEERIPQTDGERALSNAMRRVKKISAAVLVLFVLAGICLCERILQGSSVAFLVMVLVIWRLGRTAMEKEKGKFKRMAALVLALAFVVGLCAIGNALMGNPVSRMLAEKAAENYLAGKFPEGGYELKNVWFDAKRSHYGIVVQKRGSQDIRFTVDIDMWGRFHHDTYEDVLTGWNTAHRLAAEYEALADPVLSRMNLTYRQVSASCDLEFEHRQWQDDPYAFQYFLNGKALVPDGKYDMAVLGALAGKVSIRVEDAEVSAEKAAEILLEVRRVMDEAGIPFRSIDMMLEYPKPQNTVEQRKKEKIRIEGLLYEEIIKEGLIEAIRETNVSKESLDP
ncbi:MAG: zf-HC2 domain-containing protein [Oscillospiraceae bacterium]|nr:zf-HC2 domain-containing protein [Oscillospiraceae bacterium]